ncbi:sigma 54-interacting transcriptional regulator [Enterococcus asini]|uniref:sigma 54-interacting transcriptional regulator n=1 Tax=Enterococcus asini TaxID=57732 RepID=UPI00288DF180|nr:sigma 54-interacting transcriptional regulator [Enterococcus asini]MDT2757645.1 sigma 54-interacting transcriptional regulator [Enterococcus asini]
MDILDELKKIMNQYAFPEELPELCNAQYISEQLGIKRNTASKHLNMLVSQNLLIKINSRPVLFLHKALVEEKLGHTVVKTEFKSMNELVQDEPIDYKKMIFTDIIGYDESLSDVIDQTISAISYPGGLPIMLFGNSGVGKSFLAEKLSEYARLTGIIAKDAPFLELNCAQYYHNPELLSSQLFGYTKGAFTGANQDQKGIIENADGGIVFLDEVHRLSPEGQEKLFLHMDKGVYRRIGDNGPWRKSKVFYIFATTEERNNEFLSTFLRRIPITCRVPDFDERTYNDRKSIIFHLFQEESKIVDRDIIVSEATLSFLINLKTSGNIGEIKGIVKQMVAKKFSKRPNRLTIDLEIMDLPREYLLRYQNKQTNLLKVQKKYIFAAGEFIQREIEDTDFVKARKIFFKKVELSYTNYLQSKISREDLKQLFASHLAEFSDQYVYNYEIEETVQFFLPELQNIFQNMAPNVFFEVKGTTIQNVTAYLVKREQSGIDFEENKPLLDHQLYESLAGSIMKESNIVFSIFENTLDLNLSKRDRLFVLLCFFADLGNVDKKINAIILTHGYSTASSIAHVANRMIGEYVFDAIDMPFSISSKEIMAKLVNYINSVNPSEGLLILVDMGSLSDIKKDIEKIVSVPTIIMDNVSTALALNAGLKITQNIDIEFLCEALKEEFTLSSQSIVPVNRNHHRILVSCNTGVGTAIKIKEMLDTLLPPDLEIEVTPYETAALIKMSASRTITDEKNIIAIIGTDDPDMGIIPFISLEELFEGENGRLYGIFKEKFGDAVATEVDKAIVKNLSLDRLIDNLTILDPVKIMEQLDLCFNIIETEFHQKLSTSKKISLYVHLSCMIERLVRNQPIGSFPDIHDFVDQNKESIRIIKKAMKSIEQLYNVEVPIEEIGFIYNIIDLM